MTAATEPNMEDEIFRLIKRRQHVSFAELVRKIPGFDGGNVDLLSEGVENIVFWTGISEQALQALNSLHAQKKIFKHPSSTLVYFIDGMVLNLPVAKRKREYKTQHWCPITLCTYPYGKRKAKR